MVVVRRRRIVQSVDLPDGRGRRRTSDRQGDHGVRHRIPWRRYLGRTRVGGGHGHQWYRASRRKGRGVGRERREMIDRRKRRHDNFYPTFVLFFLSHMVDGGVGGGGTGWWWWWWGGCGCGWRRRSRRFGCDQHLHECQRSFHLFQHPWRCRGGRRRRRRSKKKRGRWRQGTRLFVVFRRTFFGVGFRTQRQRW